MASSIYGICSAFVSRKVSPAMYVLAVICALVSCCNFCFAATGVAGAVKEAPSLVRQYLRWLVVALVVSVLLCIWEILLVGQKCEYVWETTEQHVLGSPTDANGNTRFVFMTECTKYTALISWILLGASIFLRLYFVATVYRFMLYLREKKARRGYFDYSPFSLSTDEETYQSSSSSSSSRSIWSRSKASDAPYKHMPRIESDVSPTHYLYATGSPPFSPPSPLSDDDQRRRFSF
eukprot:g9804.t1